MTIPATPPAPSPDPNIAKTSVYQTPSDEVNKLAEIVDDDEMPDLITKTSKWAGLPKWDSTSRIRKPVVRYGFDADTEATEGGQAFSSDSKQWEEVIATEYGNLEKAQVFEWVDNAPDSKRAVGSHVVYKRKFNRQGKLTKFRT
ncbi:hypothetical protein P691DRAFT_765463 [Macrolepiota fuliginosa MF-IS2]|uniref:Uncharacterized protein n=1 Tax=Macrolepiota fuliginosa MF-IS2 TaxID=1400762 RepID=A0A9P5X2S3_9AGAR|nr:hypothetical protein P691DRAFT_765463 [Macrolepiota fuliginosa MF-IS2]